MLKWIAAALLALATGLALAVAWHDRDMAVDDAYISFRYAENLLAGHGLRWNPDSPPCEGYSNLSYVVALAGLGAVGVAPTHAALLLASGGLLVIVVLLWRALRAGDSWLPVSLIPAVFVFAASDLTVHASRGLETVLFAALAACQLAAVARICSAGPVGKRHALTAAGCATALFLTRPDGVLMSAMCWLGAFWLVRADRERRRMLLGAVVLWLASGAAYAVCKLAYFGYLLPNPYYLKADVSGLAGVPETIAFVSSYGPLLLVAVLAAVATPWWLRPARVAEVRTHDAAAFLAVVIAIPWLAYGAKIVHEIGFAHRFAWPLVPVLALGATRGLSALAALWSARRSHRTWLLAWTMFAVVVAINLPAFCAQWRQLGQPRPHDSCTASFLRLGQAIFDTGLAPQLTLFCANAGATPFRAKAHHVDPVGLVDDGYSTRTSADERTHYQASLKFDIVAWNLFPASPGAQSFDEDARAMASTYLGRYWRGDDANLDAMARHAIKHQSDAERKAGLFLHMWVLREHATLVGEMSSGQQAGRLFVYVWKRSPHHDRLVEHLSTRIDIQPAAIDYDGWPR